MAKQIAIEKVRTEIALLIRLCRWSARNLNSAPEEIHRQEKSIGTLQDLCDAPGFKAPINERTGVFVRGVYRVR